MVDVDCAVGDTPCLTAADDSGYEIDEAEVIYWGRCPECAAATSVSSGNGKRTRSVRHQLGETALNPEQPRSRAESHRKETARKEKDRRD
jgi:Fur family ferric uptake transcriptional regulator